MTKFESKYNNIDNTRGGSKPVITRQWIIAVCYILLLAVLFPPRIPAETVFTTPANLQDNIDFWKKIYTEVSLNQGFIHDRDYPMIIYKTITIGKLKGRRRSRYIRNHMAGIRVWLANIANKPSSQWSSKEREIAGLFRRYATIDEVKTARKRLRFQQGQKERYKEGLERSGRYLPFILSTFLKYKIPPRIAFLPHVESSFNSRAYSRVGAAGMWQFMRRTGRRYMKINYRVDERFDPLKATVAAAKLLRYNYSQLKSWPLAITAYNHGLASMKRAVRTTKSRDLGVIIDKYKNRRFRFASKNFYGCFIAASEIAANPYPYFPDLKYDSPLKYQEIELTKYYRPRTLAKYLNISQDQIRALNPSLRSIVFRRQLSIPKGFKLRLPASISLTDAQSKLGAVPETVKKTETGGDKYYSVKRGDNLYRIARRFRVSTESLIIANEIDREDRIYIGQVLRIPGRGKAATTKSKPKVTKTAPAAVKAKPQKLPSTGNSKSKSASTQVPAQTEGKKFIFDASIYNLGVEKINNTTAILRVTVNESLGHYADWLDTTVWHLRRLNRGRRSIRVNQKIRIPLKNASSLEAFKSKRLEYHMALEEDFYSSYKVVDTRERLVEYGDTLWSICNRDEEIPIWLLKKYNRNINLDKLKVNMLLTIPVLASVLE